MKRTGLPKIILFLFIFLYSLFFVLNLKVSTRQGLNYKVRIIKIPLYLKIMDFFDRHYNYLELIKHIISPMDSKEMRVKKIFLWTFENLKAQQGELPVVDDHVWHIIIRGYGTSDQFADVFSTLCNYADVESFFRFLTGKGNSNHLTLSFVKINHKWYLFDPYNGAYFLSADDSLADIQQIKSGNWKPVCQRGGCRNVINYEEYLNNLPDNIVYSGLKRSSIQSPLKRLIFEIKKR